LGSIVEEFCPVWMKYAVLTILTIYMYLAMCLKYVAGAESFEQAISSTFFEDRCDWEREWYGYFDPYFLGLIIFGSLSLFFSFGNIENSKVLQIVTSICRLLAVGLMLIGSWIYMGEVGVNPSDPLDFGSQFQYIG